MIKKGLFIVFDGPDGAGKTTAMNSVCQWLSTNSKTDFIVTKEPGSPLNSTCVKLRQMVKDPDIDLDNNAEIFLMLADRCNHVSKVIIPALNEGKIVFCDRYAHSTYAYQGWARRHGHPQSLKDINYLNHLCTGGLIPDIVLIFTVSPEIGFARRTKRDHKTDRFEMQDSEFFIRVNKGYLDICEGKVPSDVYGKNIYHIDTDNIGEEETALKSIEIIKKYID